MPIFFGLSRDAQMLLVCSNTQLYICTQGAGGIYSSTSQIANPAFIEFMFIGKNHFAFCDVSGKAKVYNRSNYQLIQDIQSSINPLYAIAATQDFSVMATGGG